MSSTDRSAAVGAALERLGWRALAVWECQLGDADALEARRAAWLS